MLAAKGRTQEHGPLTLTLKVQSVISPYAMHKGLKVLAGGQFVEEDFVPDIDGLTYCGVVGAGPVLQQLKHSLVLHTGIG